MARQVNAANRSAYVIPHIVVVGAGFAGLAAAKGLSRSGYDVTLVDKTNHHLFQPLLYQVATAGLSPADIAGPIRSIVRGEANVRVLMDEVVAVDTSARSVKLASGAALDYNALVLATGAQHSYFGNDSWANLAPGIKTIDDALRVRQALLLAMERAETMRHEKAETRGEHLNFAVVGGGPTGVEMAGAIVELTRHAAKMDFRQLTDSCIKVFLIQGDKRLLPSFPEALSAAALRHITALGVDVKLNARVTKVGENYLIVNGERLATAAIVWAAGVKASPAAQWLGLSADQTGRVPVGPLLNIDGLPNVFAIGDTAAITDSTGAKVPGVASAAKQQGTYVAHVIDAQFRGRQPPKPFRYRDYGSLATIGRKRAVANFGWLKVSGLAAWLLWSTVHVYFLVGFRSRLVVGFNWLWHYLTFERGARLITGNRRGDM